MLSRLQAAWRARRILLVGHADVMTQFMQQFLCELGAKPARIAPSAPAESLCRAMTDGRICTVIVPRMAALSQDAGPQARLFALSVLLAEAREAGVPLVMLMSDDSVYLGRSGFPLREESPVGGETPEGLAQALAELYALGVSRGLAGDPVSVLCVRHMPCLACGHPAVQPGDDWCRMLLAGERLIVPHPDAQGVFLHPLDVCCGAALLGARFLSGDSSLTGAVNLAPGPENLLSNRTAALAFLRDAGGTRPIHETHPPHGAPLPMLDGSRAKLLCGAACRIPAQKALSMLLALRRTEDGSAAQAQCIRTQTQAYLQQLGT